jgi:hypothetical protein
MEEGRCVHDVGDRGADGGQRRKEDRTSRTEGGRQDNIGSSRARRMAANSQLA